MSKFDNKPIKTKKVWVLQTGCGAILDIVEDRIEYAKKLERKVPTNASWIKMNAENHDGCLVIKEPL
jgi:hypothetical protein